MDKAYGATSAVGMGASISAPKQSQSEAALSHMARVVSIFNECRGMACGASERILGPTPTEAGPTAGIKSGPNNGFMGSLEYQLGELEILGNQLRDELGRIVRAF